MIQIQIAHRAQLLHQPFKDQVVDFLHQHLGKYGDKAEAIAKAYDYLVQGPGGMLLTAKQEDILVGAVIINKTGMMDYIPENILVYIASHEHYRGQGIGRQLMQTAIANCDGNIALHVEHDNPALGLYQRFGFKNKYLEMRLEKKEVAYGVTNP